MGASQDTQRHLTCTNGKDGNASLKSLKNLNPLREFKDRNRHVNL